jgi:hypothetical protein
LSIAPPPWALASGFHLGYFTPNFPYQIASHAKAPEDLSGVKIVILQSKLGIHALRNPNPLGGARVSQHEYLA